MVIAIVGGGAPKSHGSRDAMEHTTFTGVSGTFRFSPAQHYGLGEESVLMSQIENGQFHIAK